MPNRRTRAARARIARRCLVVVALAASAACASHPAAATGAAPAPAVTATQAGALAAYAGHPLAVFPLQRVSDSSAAAPDSLRQRFDDAFAAAARAHGVASGWAMAAELERSARRNPGYVTDPRALTIAGLASRRSDDGLTAQLGGEVRAAVALHDARYAVVPHLLRFAPDGAGRGATASVVVIDARLARVVWRADVAARSADDATATTAVAERVAALFVAP